MNIVKAWIRSFAPANRKEASDSIVDNLLLHWFPNKVFRRSYAFSYSFWLGTIAMSLFLIMAVTGVILMFLYIPSVERAYWTMKDIDYVVSYGWLLRGVHRMAAHFMVAVVFFHLVRTFYTAAYRSSPKMVRADRRVNWIIGNVLLVLTLALSYTGYLLPWDQLAYWALIIGANVAQSTPVIGDTIKELLIGGTEIGQNALLRFYILHCIALPLLLTVGFFFHMWRIRKDGGLACVDSAVEGSGEITAEPASDKSYLLLGAPAQTRYTVTTSAFLHPRNFIQGNPHVVKRVLWVFTLTLAVTVLFACLLKMPLEAPANPAVAPNPAKAPWYFLWLQELIADTTVRIGGITLNGGFIGGVLIPTVCVLALAAWPYLDRSPPQAIGVWFHRSRWLQNAVFTLVVLVILALIYVAAFLRGPNWILYPPGVPWPLEPPIL